MKTIACSCCKTVVNTCEAEFESGRFYCSFDCLAFEQDKQREAFDSYAVSDQDQSGEYRSLYGSEFN